MTRGPPPYRTPLVGRDALLARLVRLVRGGGVLVTVVGPGGVGKTRLAAEAARQVGDRVVFVDLGGARSRDDVSAAALAATGSSDAGSGPISARAVAALVAAEPELVVLDNAEQVVEPVRDLADALLAAPSPVSVCVTSRTPLRARQERLLEVAPLTAPEAAMQVLLQGLPVSATAPDLDPDDVAALVRATDGLPLALELAGARLSVLDPRELVDGIGRTAKALRDPARRGRHASMDAAIRWSWDLATPVERDALLQVVQFVGTFDLPAAEAVLSLGADLTAADVLHSLVSSSWIRSEVHRGGRRFRMWDTVRAFLRDLPRPDGVAERFQAHFAARAEGFGRRAVGDALPGELAAADPDLANLLAAIELGGPDAARICVGAYKLLMRRLERRACAELCLATVDVAPAAILLPLYWRAADDLVLVGEVDRGVEAGLRARAALGPQATTTQRVAVALTLATAQLHAGRCEASAATLEEVAPLADAVDPAVRTRLFMDLGNLAHDLGRGDEAARWIAAAADGIDRVADPALRETYSLRLGILELRARRLDEGEERLVRLLAAPSATRFELTLAAAWCYRAVARWLRGDPEGADAAWAEVDRYEVPGIHEAVHRSIRAASTLSRWPDRARSDALAALALIDAHDHASLETYCRPLVRAVLAVVGVPQPPPPARRRLEGAYPFVPVAAPRVDELLEGRAAAATGRATAAELEALPSFEAALFAAVVRAAAAVAERAERTWTLSPDGVRFRPPASDWIDLSHRPRMVAMVRALVGSASPLAVSSLFEAVWPGERALPASAANRVRVTASQLRSLGLTIVRFHDGGYRLDPDVPIRIEGLQPPAPRP